MGYLAMEKLDKKLNEAELTIPLNQESQIPSVPVTDEEFEASKRHIIKRHLNLFKKLAR